MFCFSDFGHGNFSLSKPSLGGDHGDCRRNASNRKMAPPHLNKWPSRSVSWPSPLWGHGGLTKDKSAWGCGQRRWSPNTPRTWSHILIYWDAFLAHPSPLLPCSATAPCPHLSFPYLVVKEAVGQEQDQAGLCPFTGQTDYGLGTKFNTFSKESHLNDLILGNISISSINGIPDLKLLHKWKAHFKHKTDGKFLKVWSARISGSLMVYKLHPQKDQPVGWRKEGTFSVYVPFEQLILIPNDTQCPSWGSVAPTKETRPPTEKSAAIGLQARWNVAKCARRISWRLYSTGAGFLVVTV